MKLKTVIMIILLLLVAIVTQITAEVTHKPILEKGDVERFLKTFPQMKADFEKHGAKYEGKGNYNIPEALKANADFQALLKKHGWDTLFFAKMMTIFRGYASIEYGKQMKEAAPKIKEALKKLESNPHLSAEMKEKMKKSMMGVTALTGQRDLMGGINPQDMALIKPFINEIRELMESEKQKRRKKRRSN
jgi:hypothetical protein